MTNLITSITGLVICLLGFLQVLVNRLHEERTRKYILCFFAVLIVYVASDLISQIGDMNTGRGWYLTAKIGLFISSLSSAMLIPLLTTFTVSILRKQGILISIAQNADHVPAITRCVRAVIHSANLSVCVYRVCRFLLLSGKQSFDRIHGCNPRQLLLL